MPQFYPNSSTLYVAALMRSELALSKLRLFQVPFVPSVSTLRADLVAAEADYTGYTAGGEAITAFLAPLLSPFGGASIDWPTEQFAPASPFTVGNVIGGWWLETAAGVVIAIGTFSESIPMGALGQGFAFPGTLVYR